MDIRLRNRNRAHQCCYLPLLVTDLSFESSLFGNGCFEGILIWAFVDFVQRFALFHKLVVAHIQADERAVYLRRYPDEVRKYFGVLCSWMVVRVVKRNQSQHDGT